MVHRPAIRSLLRVDHNEAPLIGRLRVINVINVLIRRPCDGVSVTVDQRGNHAAKSVSRSSPGMRIMPETVLRKDTGGERRISQPT